MNKQMSRLLFSGALALAGTLQTASATTLGITGGTQTEVFEPEVGGSLPGGTGGFMDGMLVALVTGNYTFIYGGNGVLAGDTGHGNTPLFNAFWVGDRTAASLAGNIFCTQAITGLCTASAVGASFNVAFSAGSTIPFHFSFGPTDSLANPQLQNGEFNPNVGAVLVQIGLGTTANAGPGGIAYIGLSDSPYPGDHDFQDLVVTVENVPEPSSLMLSTAGIGVAFLLVGLRRRQAVVSI